MSREGARSTSLISALMWNPTFEVVYIKYCTIYDLYIGFYDVVSIILKLFCFYHVLYNVKQLFSVLFIYK